MFGRKIVSMSQGRIKLSEGNITKLIDSMIEAEVKIIFAPDSDEYFLIDEVEGVSLCLEQSKLKVVNHDFIYYVPLQLSYTESQKKKLRVELEERIILLKKRLFKNEMDLLTKLNKIYRDGI